MNALRDQTVANWYICVFIGVLLFATPAGAQGWAHTYGSFGSESAFSVHPTPGGGYAVGANRSGFWLLELDSEGEVLSQRIYGGPGAGSAARMEPTGDGGHIVAGRIGPFDEPNAWLMKLDASGVIEWQKRYGGEAHVWASFVEAVGEGYVVGGGTSTFGAGETDLWVMLLDGDGDVVWQKAYGGGGSEGFGSIRATGDGGFVLAGTAHSFSDRSSDFWVVKLDAAGDIVWENIYGHDTAGIENIEFTPRAVPIETPEGTVTGYVVAGTSAPLPSGNYDIWVLELDAVGQIVRQKLHETGGDYNVVSLEAVSGGHLIGGSIGGGALRDGFLMKIDVAGEVLWQRRYGGDDPSDHDSLAFATQNASGGLVAAGSTESFDIAEGDVWVLELDATGNLEGCPAVGSSGGSGTATAEVAIATSASVTVTDAVTATVNAAVASPSYYKQNGCRIETLGWAAIPKSGQLTSYAPGDDGALRPGGPWPSPRFVDNEDGTISDRLTGLTWLTDANCADSIGYEPGDDNVGGLLDWTVALDFVAGINDGTHDIAQCAAFSATDRDWRMANINEMETLVNAEPVDLAIWLTAQGFQNVEPSNYWSSTTDVFSGYAVILQLDTHRIRTLRKGAARYVWPVRGGQSRAPDPDFPANVWKTGQKSSYHEGDDGDLEWGVAWPGPRFITNPDGTVTDRLTGLTWLQDASCLGQRKWLPALQAIADLNTNPGAQGCEGYTAEHEDWRMSNRKELRSLVEHGKYREALPIGHPFLNTALAFYWTSNTVFGGDNIAWGFYMGRSGPLLRHAKVTYALYSWPVRGGPVPEPGAGALGIAAMGTLLALRRWKRAAGSRRHEPAWPGALSNASP